MPSLQLTAMSPTQMDLRTKAFTHRNLYTQKSLHCRFLHRNLYAERFYTISFYREESELLHRKKITQKNFDTQADAFTQGIHLCRSVFTHTKF